MRIIAPAAALPFALLLVSAAQAAPVASCGFDAATLSFAGSASEQAKCLLRPVRKYGQLGLAPASLPPTLAMLIGTAADLDITKLRSALNSRGIATDALARPVSRARGGQANAPLARYFVIHDTSTPWLGDRPFPSDIDTTSAINDLKRFIGPNAVAHVFVNRRGETAFGHDFSIPWRATKLENNVIGMPAKGLFLHVENVQPRRRDPRGAAGNDAIAPSPGLTDAQYDRLAVLYAYASRRAGRWLIPAFHAALDAGLADGHDDPQNFDLAKFDAAIRSVLNEIGGVR